MGIKQLAMRCLRPAMQAVYEIMKLFSHPRDRVVFLSRQSDTPSQDFMLLAEEIKRQSPATETVFSCRLGLRSEMNASYIPLLLRQMALLASARACVVESYIPPVSMLCHRRGMTVTQIWHSMAAIKKFGWQTVDTPEGSSRQTAEAMCMHRGYDRVITGSEYMIPFFAEAMDTDPARCLPLGAPHADRLIAAGRGSTRAALEQRFPAIRGKRLVVYLPTMRRGRAIDCAAFLDSFDYSAAALIIKLHPLDRDTIIENVQAVVSDEPTADLLLAADAVVTDYSGTASDAACIGLPVYFYLPDYDEYSAQCGINMDAREVFPAAAFEDGEALSRAVLTDHGECAKQRELLAGGCDGHSSEKIAKLVLRAK